MADAGKGPEEEAPIDITEVRKDDEMIDRVAEGGKGDADDPLTALLEALRDQGRG